MEWTSFDEKIDVFSYGNNIYALLTGQRVSWETAGGISEQKQTMLNYSAAAYSQFKNKSFAERKLVEIMIRCWEFDPSARVSIFEVVKFLREVVEQDTHGRL